MAKKVLAMILMLTLMVSAMFMFTGCLAQEKGDGSADGSTDGGKREELVCGVTIFDGMNEQDENGNWIGFESEFAMEVGKILNMDVKFQIIDWSQKYTELNSGKIDCIWNGFTANSSDDGIERKDLVDFSYTYMLNQQCIVIKSSNADKFKTEDDLKGKTAAVEGGSAGAAYAKDAVGESGSLVEFPAQNSAFLEVKSGKSDFAVVDILLAKNVCGKGDYTDLVIVEDIELAAEYYAIGFKKGSDLTAKVNDAIKQLDENGKLLEIAKKYGFENTLQVSYE